MATGDTLRRFVADDLGRRSEPGARRFLDTETGRPHADVVAALTQVGVGIEREARGDPLSDEGVCEQLAAWLVDTVLVNPNDPRSTYRPPMQIGVHGQFVARGTPPPGARVLDALAELAVGAYGDADPRAKRIASPRLVVEQYLRGRAGARTKVARKKK